MFLSLNFFYIKTKDEGSKRMDRLRLFEKNKINSDIKSLESLLKRTAETIERFKHQDATLFVKTQIDKLSVKKNEYEDELNGLNERLVDLIAGKLDDSLTENNANDMRKIQKKQEITIRKKKDKDDEKKMDSEILKKYHDKQNRYEFSETFWNREEKKYYKNCDSLPQWMRDKLKDMPSNKGYIWRDLWFFGEKHVPFTKNCTMFESLKGVTIIHEIDAEYHRVYEKHGKANKVLVQKIQRNKF